MKQKGKKSEDITGKVDLQSSELHLQLHIKEKEKEKGEHIKAHEAKGAYAICTRKDWSMIVLWREELELRKRKEGKEGKHRYRLKTKQDGIEATGDD